ncbi:MAG: endolytic transglycosylase MltG [Coxiellaceae bacterium]|nr:MAG: endolytic transglycosylase MltG [Coxiellaceae bacterium]
MPRWLVNTLLVLTLLVLIWIAWLCSAWKKFFDAPLIANNIPVEIEVQPGTTPSAIAWQLKRQGLNIDPKRFIQWARLRGDLTRIKAGEYRIMPGMTASQFLSQMVAGRTIMRQFTIVEGWTFGQLMDALNRNPYVSHQLQGLDDASIMARIGHPNLYPEGMFYPSTYLFSRGTSDIKLLQMAYNNMQQVLGQLWQQRAPNLFYQNSYQALIVASMIEKETAVISERPMVAGVIMRRLDKNMRLQIDPTVMYGLNKNYTQKLTGNDLKIDTAYNTYTRNGLPPTPIAMPSASSITAALHPAAGDALYYVATGVGGHAFSNTLKAHDVAIKQYLLRPQFCPMPDKLMLNLLLRQPVTYFCQQPQRIANAN